MSNDSNPTWYEFDVTLKDGRVLTVKAHADRWEQAESNMLAGMLDDGHDVRKWARKQSA